MEALHPRVNTTFKQRRQRTRVNASKVSLVSFTEGDDGLVARKDFGLGEKVCLQWHGLCRVIMALNNYVFVNGSLCNGKTEELRGTRLKIYIESSLN